MNVRIREDGSTRNSNRVDFGAESIVDLAGVAPELVVVHKPAAISNQSIYTLLQPSTINQYIQHISINNQYILLTYNH